MSPFDGPGTARALCRSMHWSSTPLGPPSAWPEALTSAVRLVMASGFPMCVLWGPEFVQIYNDAMATVFADKHPAVLGQPSRLGWPEAWHINEPLFARVMAGETVTQENAPYESLRRGFAELMTIHASFSPITDGDGVAGGVLATLVETTDGGALLRLQTEHSRLRDDTIRARQQAERERAMSASVLESMNDCYFALDTDYRFITVNRAMEAVVRKDRDSILGRSIWDVFPGAEDFEFGTNYKQVMEQRVAAHFAAPYSEFDISLIAEVDAYPTEPSGIAVFWRDISEQQRVQEALTESEARFRAVQDASPNGSVLLQPVRDAEQRIVDWRYVYINHAGAALARISRDELIGKQLIATFPSARTGSHVRYQRIFDSGHAEDWEQRYVNDGYDVGLSVQAIRIGELLHVRFADVTGRMVAEREREQLLEAVQHAYAETRAAEERLRDVFEQAPLAIAVLTGPSHVYTIVSPEYARSPGNGRELLGKSMLEAFPEIDPNGFPRLLDRVYRTGVPYRAVEQRVSLLDAHGVAQEHYFNIGYQPLRNGDGEVYAVASVAYNVTEQIRARQQVDAARAAAEVAQKEAEAANKAKGEFLAVMSHELRTPLNAIGGYAELIDIGVHGPVTDAQRNALSRIQQSQRHLLGLINGVLNYSRVEAGAVTYQLTRVLVAEAIAEAESLVAPQLRAKGLEYSWGACPPNLAVMVDREKMQQILLNLLSNAVKFTDPRDGRPGQIEVSSEQRGGVILVHVCDNGVGIAPDKLRAVFEPFVQVDQRLTRRQEGVGLGLTISRDLARGMGGDLTATSTPGEGSIFTMTLPMA